MGAFLLVGFFLTLSTQTSSGQTAPGVLPSGQLGKTIQLGKELVENTVSNQLTKPYVKNALNCAACHLSGDAGPATSFIGTAAAYPAYSPREKTVVSLEDRIANCFMRSEDGTRPPLGSQVTIAIAAYITWLSTDTPIRQNAIRPSGPNGLADSKLDPGTADLKAGSALYEAKCSSCHGADGQGAGAFPPVWGSHSYNAGAGLAHVAKLAGFLKVTMPPGNTTLTDQEASDVAAFVDSKPRPDFVLGEHLPKTELGVYNSNVPLEVDRIKVGAINP